jgi:hypothetical protein
MTQNKERYTLREAVKLAIGMGAAWYYKARISGVYDFYTDGPVDDDERRCNIVLQWYSSSRSINVIMVPACICLLERPIKELIERLGI